MVEGKLNFSTKFAFGVGQAGEGVFNVGLASFFYSTTARFLVLILPWPRVQSESQ